jgi:hypothetical protein
MKTSAIPVDEGSTPASRPERKIYERPEIIDYGTVVELTRGTGSNAFDSHGGRRTQ